MRTVSISCLLALCTALSSFALLSFGLQQKRTGDRFQSLEGGGGTGGETLSSPVSEGSGRRTSKIAFLFLVREKVFHPDLWEDFFRHEEDRGLWSLYINVGNASVTVEDAKRQTSPFIASHLIRRVEAGWGALVEATNNLYKAALEDPDNQMFVLLSESTLPVKPLHYVYNYIFSNNTTPDGLPRSLFCLTDQEKLPEGMEAKASEWTILSRKHVAVLNRDPPADEGWFRTPRGNVAAASDEWVFLKALLDRYGTENRAEFWREVNTGTDTPVPRRDFPQMCTTWICWETDPRPPTPTPPSALDPDTQVSTDLSCNAAGVRNQHNAYRVPAEFDALELSFLHRLVAHPQWLFARKFVPSPAVMTGCDAEKEGGEASLLDSSEKKRRERKWEDLGVLSPKDARAPCQRVSVPLWPDLSNLTPHTDPRLIAKEMAAPERARWGHSEMRLAGGFHPLLDNLMSFVWPRNQVQM
uniref:Glycosyl transferase 64 domain-containing protein n=1 Tax=Chromera velia CCMP2878 TaxID=1169474 RepID=A0A0G4FFD3_9ALVE|eukprot:Cvel_16692.t1-p1 / transcript=Cvel_16692.t1 / gene=Cvel_16692 / organism=Chromera_velia_CCMP2878 / gene_product=hypothetical protein / transcript_product=hypothetical protein / location=Cvel_scaffold1296:22898-24304(+) / protein_length=469 / sequence_SO=supercontig / SO=protein_coding / is_pseudo=false